MSSAVIEHRDLKEAPPAADSENTGAQFAPIVQLDEAAVTIGEEEEDAILDLKAKLYRFNKDSNEWKERGAGTVQFLKHKKTGKVRLVMRQSKSLMICANHLVLPNMTVQERNEKSCVWKATDIADGESKKELFCCRFASIEHNQLFMEKFQEVAESQSPEEESNFATEGAELIAKLNIGENYEAEEPATVKKRKQKKSHLQPRKRTKKTKSRVKVVLSNFFGSRVKVVLTGCFGRPHQKSGLDLQVTVED